MNQIIYGVGRAIIADHVDPTKIIAFTDLQDLSVESSSSKEDITAGNKAFPIASFPKDQSLKISATNATFDSALMEYLDGAGVAKGATLVRDVLDVAIPADGVVTLPETIVGDVYVSGFTKSATTATAGQFTVSDNEVTFAVADAGKEVAIVYSFNTGAEAVEYSVKAGATSKPFRLDYIFPIYDKNSEHVANGHITLFKAQCTSGFKIDTKHMTAFAPKFDAEARDAKRADGKLWSFVVNKVNA